MNKETEAFQFANHYQNISDICKMFLTTLSGRKFNYTNDSAHMFIIMSLDNLKLETRGIATLIQNHLYMQSFSHIRNIFELFVNLYWISSANDEERIEYIAQLDAFPYYWHEKEVNAWEQNLSSNKPVWTAEYVNDARKALAEIKKKYPNLINEQKLFKKPRPLASRISEEIRLKYYFIYKFSSIFVHPSPFFKDVHFKNVINGKEPMDILGEPLLETLTYGLWLTYLCFFGYIKVFDNKDIKGFMVREKHVNSMYDLFNEANKEYIQLSD